MENIDKITELTEQINSLSKQLEEANNKIEAQNIKLGEKDKLLEDNATNIKELKLKNYDLLLQVGTPVKEEVIMEKEEPSMSVRDVTNILMGDK